MHAGFRWVDPVGCGRETKDSSQPGTSRYTIRARSRTYRTSRMHSAKRSRQVQDQSSSGKHSQDAIAAGRHPRGKASLPTLRERRVPIPLR